MKSATKLINTKKLVNVLTRLVRLHKVFDNHFRAQMLLSWSAFLTSEPAAVERHRDQVGGLKT